MTPALTESHIRREEAILFPLRYFVAGCFSTGTALMRYLIEM